MPTVPLRLVANENVSRTVIQELRDRGHDVLSVKESMRAADDASVLARAQAGMAVMRRARRCADL